MPSLPPCRFHACVNPVHEKPLITVVQKAASEGMLVVVYFSGLCCFPFPPAENGVCLAAVFLSVRKLMFGWSDAEGLFTVAPWGECDVK